MTEPTELWKLPVSPTRLRRDPQLAVHRRRRFTLSMSWEGDESDVVTATIDLADVEAYRVTYLHSLTKEMISTAYGRLVDLGESDWLRESLAVRGRPSGTKLRHVRICFDDGPCYEFLCTAAEVNTSVRPGKPGGA